MTDWPLLSLLIWVPVAGAVPVLAAGHAHPRLARWLSLAVSLIVFALSLCLIPNFDFGTSAMQFAESHAWRPAIHSQYKLGVDGISGALIILTTFTTVLVIGGAWEVIRERVHQYMAAMLVLEAFLIGMFCADRKS